MSRVHTIRTTNRFCGIFFRFEVFKLLKRFCSTLGFLGHFAYTVLFSSDIAENKINIYSRLKNKRAYIFSTSGDLVFKQNDLPRVSRVYLINKAHVPISR